MTSAVVQYAAETSGLVSRVILGMRTDATCYADAAIRVLAWAGSAESRYVCVANVHMTMETHDSDAFRGIVNGADLVTPDGMPLVWALRMFGVRSATRVVGIRLTLQVLRHAAAEGTPVGFYGGSPAVLRRMVTECIKRFPTLRVAYECSPPFRPVTAAEDDAIIADINASGARILFVGLGCPKQERWMAAHRGKVGSVMLGVGAAFDFLAGSKPLAPNWMQNAGLEWLFRLATEPRRLWWRYAYHNPRFVALLTRQYLGSLAS
ncbi:MAG: glycosyl transferase, WecB/TagA/CpsF family [Gemmatimonadetes bacterium]|nr:glycosyl transferase, WecB/TagA/CpsF family [Gemmatimonadota bacterium]